MWYNQATNLKERTIRVKKVYRYYCPFRPPMPGAIPRRGLVRTCEYDYKQCIGGVGAWGFAEYDRQLTEQEVSDYELVEGKNNPLEY